VTLAPHPAPAPRAPCCCTQCTRPRTHAVLALGHQSLSIDGRHRHPSAPLPPPSICTAATAIHLHRLSCAAAGLAGLSIFRTFRLLRIFKLARSWHELQRLLTTLVKSVRAVGNLSLILLLYVFVFALLGMQVRLWMLCHPCSQSMFDQ